MRPDPSCTSERLMYNLYSFNIEGMTGVCYELGGIVKCRGPAMKRHLGAEEP